MKSKTGNRGTRRKRTAVVPGMIFGLGAAMAPAVPGCGPGSSVEVFDLGVSAVPDLSRSFDIGVMAPDKGIPDQGPNFDLGVSALHDLQVPDLAVAQDGGVSDGGDDGTGGDR